MGDPELTEFAKLRRRYGLPVDDAAALAGVDRRTAYRWERGDSRPKRAFLDAIRQVCERHPSYQAGNERLRFVDFFAGIGGFRLAFESTGAVCVASCEWDQRCRETYSANFPADNHPFFGDIRELPESMVPEHDIFVAGFPCQPFSIAGVSKKNALGRAHGFACEAQGTLFFEIARLLRAHRPRAFLLENVKNLVSHDHGRTFKIILRTLRDELGYHVEWGVVDAKPYVPQHRERTVIVGTSDDIGFRINDLKPQSRGEWPLLGSILHPEDGSEDAEAPFTEGRRARVVAKYTLSDHLWNYLQRYAEKHRAAGNGFGFGLFGPEDTARTLSARYYKDGSEILIRQKRRNPRRLTPRECARLMGFDQFRPSGFRIPVSDTQAYKQFGNSVAVPAMAAVASQLTRCLRGETPAQSGQARLPFLGVHAVSQRSAALD